MSLVEINVIRKAWRKTPIKIALCYPNEYRAGIASLAIQTLYRRFNSEPDVLCDRYYTGSSALQLIPPYTIESNRHLSEYDVLAFSLQYESDYFRFVNTVAQVTHIPLNKKEINRPMILIGGPCATANPIPISDFFDIAIVGELDPVINKILCFLRGPKPFVPRLHELQGQGILHSKDGKKIKKQFCPCLDDAFHPVAQVRPIHPTEIKGRLAFGDAFLLSPSRGCPYSCRFCMLSSLQRPVRHRSIKSVLSILEKGIELTRTRKVALIASAITDYPALTDLCWALNNRQIQYSLSSLRVDRVNEDLLEALKTSGQKTVTLAPETGTDRLRRIIHKPFTNDQLQQVADALANHGIRHLRLYYIIGLPYEDQGDIEGIQRQIQNLVHGSATRTLKISITATPFIPKPHTPFQWARQLSITDLKRRFRVLQKGVRKLVHGDIHGLDPRWAQIQAILSLGSMTLGQVIDFAAKAGGTASSWRKALNELKIDVDTLIGPKDLDASLPWDHIDLGKSKNYLLKEYASIFAGNTNNTLTA
ncbi:MAG: radical SAM protein [Candidatus Ranarchaeia archaeon]